ncbi:MAG TPA: DUF1152 domain-containing protein [Solirubrobacteraceae bacterium]|nr:DUF1152 domain-containing protein [Solirubrobacteraceae bacterium]
MGIGGGGDVVGTLAAAGVAAAGGTPAVLGGLTWERRPIDPLPGARRLDEITGVRVLHPAVALAGPNAAGPGGFRFAEGRMAELLGEPTVLVDPNGGPAAIAAGLAHACAALDADVVVLLDVGGDALAHGDEPGLASPLADAVVLASAPALAAAGVTVLGAVFGAGCDGELTPAEVAARIAEVAAAGGALGDHELDAATLERVAAAVEAVPTEASAMALRCARGETGRATIREGRRTVPLTPAGGRVFFFDPEVAIASAARLAAAVRGARDMEHAHAILLGLGVARTELRYERDAAAAAG